MSIDPREAARIVERVMTKWCKQDSLRDMLDEITAELLAGEGPSIRDAALEAIGAIKSATISPAVRDAPGWAEAIEAAAKVAEALGAELRGRGPYAMWDRSQYDEGGAIAAEEIATTIRSLHPSVAEPK